MVNVLSVIVSAVLIFIIGMLWYSPVFFGNQWMKLMKFKKKDLKPKPSVMITGVASTFLTVAILGVFIMLTNARTIGEGLTIAGLIWLGFTATSLLNGVLWENKPFKLYLINAMHSLTTLLVAGAILAVW